MPLLIFGILTLSPKWLVLLSGLGLVLGTSISSQAETQS